MTGLRHLTSLVLCGFFVRGSDLRSISNSLGSTLQRLETWIPFVDQNALTGFIALKQLRLALMARKEDAWTENVETETQESALHLQSPAVDPASATGLQMASPVNLDEASLTRLQMSSPVNFDEASLTGLQMSATANLDEASLTGLQMLPPPALDEASLTRLQMSSPTVLTPSLPLADDRMQVWSRDRIRNLEVFLEIDRPPVRRIDGMLDLNPVLECLASRFGPKGLVDLHVDVGPEPMKPLTNGIRQIFRDSIHLENLTLYGGQRRHPQLDISAFSQAPRCIRTLNIFGVQLKEDFLWMDSDKANARIQSQTNDDVKVETRLSGWRPGFENWHKQSWKRM